MPPLRGRVNDLADLLPPDRERALEARLAAFEGETTHQLAVLTVPTTGGEPIADYALRVAETWKLGQKGLDNGMLLVIAKEDREAWVTVGYGLEGAVPDVVANRVIEDVMIPRFRDGDFAGGISAACEGLIRAARGEEIPAERRPSPAFRTRPNADPMMALIFSMMAASFVSLPFRRRGRPLGALLGGGAAAAVMWLLLASALFAGLGFVLGAFLSAMGPMQMGGPRRGRWGGGGFGGGFGGGGFGGGGGGFGGGGGRFGGGGAGGRW